MKAATPSPRGLGKRSEGDSRACRPHRLLANGADGVSDIEGKTVTGSGEQAGTRASLNGAQGCVRHRWVKPRGRMELWEKRHGRQSREGSGEEAGTRPSFK